MRALAPLLFLAACAGVETSGLVADPDGLPPRAQVAEVPFFPQADKACGPAALAMALSWSGQAATPEAASMQVYTPGREGSLAADMLGAARRNGALAVPIQGLRGVLGEIAAGHPVVVFQNLGLEVKPLWHFAVAIGYDLPRREMVLHSGLDEAVVMGLDTFEHTWRRTGSWAMVVLPPGSLPATSPPRAVLEAAAALERVRRPEAAERTYRAMLVRWPDNSRAAFGLGNARHALGDLLGAEEAFSLATALAPSWPLAWNNLAHMLHQRGETDEALAAARRAAALANSDGPWLETLAEVEKGIYAPAD